MILARSTLLMLAGTLALAGVVHAQSLPKRPLDHQVYEVWDTIGGAAISPDGKWALYSLIGYDRDGEVRVRAAAGETEHAFARGASARFTPDSRFAVLQIRPTRAALAEARREKRRPDQMPKDSLAIVDLTTGQVTRIERVRSFALPEEGAGWLAYHLEKEAGAAEERPAAQGTAGKRKRDEGSTLVLRKLEDGTERRFADVVAYAFTRDGRRLAYSAATRDGAGSGVYVVDVAAGTATPVLSGDGEYRRLAWDERGEQLAFLTNRDDIAARQPAYALYHWRAGGREARRVAAEGAAGVPSGWWVSEHGEVSFSRDGRRLFFGTSPRPEPEAEEEAEERVRVDIWHWNDPQIQPMQLLRAGQERRRSYDAVYHIREGKIVQLADEDVPEVTVGARGDADVALGTASLPYAQLSSWDTPSYADYFLVDVRTGRRERVREKAQGGTSLSPGARYATWFDSREGAWFALDVRTRRTVKLTEAIPHPLADEDHDTPSPAPSYGVAGWTDGDAALIVYDRYDLWAVDPSGRSAPRNITEGAGRRENIRFRYVRLDRERETIDPAAPMLLSAFQLRSKDAGFYRDRVNGTQAPERLVFMDRAFSTPRKAEKAEVLLFSRQSFQEFPDLWVAGTDFRDARPITAANPQQAEYLWGSAELVEWTSTDGVPLQGILYRPENFDPSKQYPMMVYFYERMSDELHTHYAPVPHRSRINFTFFASRGYLVFVPDIVYRTGYPGESALNAVMPGIMKLLEQGFVDDANIGVQGHSWGGYQIAYMVTRTTLFKAAGAGAPVANMTSAYGGIRWESGMGRQFQYERTQSRIGATLWEAPVRYIENSPLFWLDKVETPLLVMHNDHDGAVPWYQGIELYLGLRRLGKPVWLVNYNDEPHWPTTAANKRDWNIRMQQFFDHYLKGDPAPVWIVEGVPAVRKGRTLGLELVGEPRGIATDRKDP